MLYKFLDSIWLEAPNGPIAGNIWVGARLRLLRDVLDRARAPIAVLSSASRAF